MLINILTHIFTWVFVIFFILSLLSSKRPRTALFWYFGKLEKTPKLALTLNISICVLSFLLFSFFIRYDPDFQKQKAENDKKRKENEEAKEWEQKAEKRKLEQKDAEHEILLSKFKTGYIYFDNGEDAKAKYENGKVLLNFKSWSDNQILSKTLKVEKEGVTKDYFLLECTDELTSEPVEVKFEKYESLTKSSQNEKFKKSAGFDIKLTLSSKTEYHHSFNGNFK
jgi:hypothetical protein